MLFNQGLRSVATLRFCVLGLWISLQGQSIAAPPYQLPQVYAAITQYYQSGEFFSDVDLAINDAKSALAKSGEAKDSKAIIFDLDGTLLNLFDASIGNRYCSTNTDIIKAYEEASLPGIDSVVNFYHWCQRKGYAVIVLTARPIKYLAQVKKNLKRIGIEKWTAVICRDKSYPSNAAFKKQAIERIAADGLDVIMNIGDQESDMQRLAGIIDVKVPNPIFAVP